VSLHLQFGSSCRHLIAIVYRHDIYKWHADQRRLAARGRATSLIASRTPDPVFEHIHEPGGFRRNYVLMRANEQGAEEPRILNNFIDFLYIFGHFVSRSLLAWMVLTFTYRREKTWRKMRRTTRMTRRWSEKRHITLRKT
jgi:hypothetical protein